MAYSRTTWENSPSTATPISAALLNNMEQGIVDVDGSISSISGSVTSISGSVTSIAGSVSTISGSVNNTAGSVIALAGTAGTAYNLTSTYGSVVSTQGSVANIAGTAGTAYNLTSTYGSVSSHVSATTSVHGITDTANLVYTDNATLGSVATINASLGSVAGTVTTNTAAITATQGSVDARTGILNLSYIQTPKVTPTSSSIYSWGIAFTSNDNSYYCLLRDASPGTAQKRHLAYTNNNGGSFTFPNGGTAGTGLPISTTGGNTARICCSSNGNIIYVVINPDNATYYNIYKSNDSGATFAATTSGTANWTPNFAAQNIICSSNGSVVYASKDGTAIVSSTNAGATWSTANLSAGTYLYSLSCSSNGSIAFVATSSSGDGNILVTTNAGATWSTATSAGTNKLWRTIACSSNGSVVVAGAHSSSIANYCYLSLSTDAGTTWSDLTGAGLNSWTYAAISPDGNKIVAKGVYHTYSSINMGTTFYLEPTATGNVWSGPKNFLPSGSAVIGWQLDGAKLNFIY